MRMTARGPSTAMLAIAAAMSSTANASIVYTSPDFVHVAEVIDNNGWCTSCGGRFEVADKFTLSSSANLTGLDFGILRGHGSGWNIEVGIWDESLSTRLFVGTFPTGSYGIEDVGGLGAVLSFAFDGPMLEAGTYRMSWYEPARMAVPMMWNGTTLVQSLARFDSSESNPYTLGGGAAFQLHADPVNAVAEPSTIALGALAGLALLLSRRKALQKRTE
jgi:hypothetical protein